VAEDLGTDVVFTRAEDNRAGWGAAEILRVKAHRLATESPQNATSVQHLLQRSLAISRRQGALAWELRASMSLARLWQSQGRISQAAKLLQTAMAQFTEGFETRDFFKARALLDEILDQSGGECVPESRAFSHPKQLMGPGRNVPVTRLDFIMPLRPN